MVALGRAKNHKVSRGNDTALTLGGNARNTGSAYNVKSSVSRRTNKVYYCLTDVGKKRCRDKTKCATCAAKKGMTVASNC